MDTNHTEIVVHPCVPYALSWGRSIAAAGNDGKVMFYDIHAGVEHTFDYGKGGRCKVRPCVDAAAFVGFMCIIIWHI